MKFTPGQKVSVSKAQSTNGLPEGEYVIDSADAHWVHLKSDRRLSYTCGWYPRRFTAVPVKAKAPNKPVSATVNRAPNGRFVGKPVERPAVLRKSAIYKVKRKRGFSLAKFVAEVVTKGNSFVVLAAHGKPFVVKKANVTFANKQEVEQYLTAAK